MIRATQQRDRHIARQILIHIMIHGHLENQGITDNSLPVARELEREGILKMHRNSIDFVLSDAEDAKKKALFLIHGS